ncbi:MAG: diadenylate cyclase [Clostridiales bacterium]|nr:diadenylate cyclase [Clostridiales bacterium]
MSNSAFISQIFQFINELINSLDKGTLFFGSPWDFIRYAADILLVTFLFYTILLFIRQTRAWQLIKGIVLILIFVSFCGVMGLDMVGFIFNRMLYVVAILFVVLFQPELRRALETVGLRTSSRFMDPFRHQEKLNSTELSTFINEICIACKEMCRSYTGALILIERKTKLNELLSQENVVKFDSSVTSSVLQSIFYKGSPMHDGGLLIRDGRIVAARCHVPLSVTMHALERTGTRHRAAIGASEMGDTVVVVVSEERGKTSIAVNGRLFEMKDSKELEANLSYLLGLTQNETGKSGISKIFGRFRKRIATAEAEKTPDATAQTAEKKEGSDAPVEKNTPLVIKTKEADQTTNAQRVSVTTRVLFLIVSLILSTFLWLYIQIDNNPVVTRNITVPITYPEDRSDVSVSFPIDEVELRIVGRKNTINALTAKDIVATVQYDNMPENKEGVVEVPVEVKSKDPNKYFRVESRYPQSLRVVKFRTESK